MIGLEDKCVHEQKRKVHGQLVHIEHQVLEIADRPNGFARLSSIDDTLAETGKALVDEQAGPSSECDIVSSLPIAC